MSLEPGILVSFQEKLLEKREGWMWGEQVELMFTQDECYRIHSPTIFAVLYKGTFAFTEGQVTLASDEDQDVLERVTYMVYISVADHKLTFEAVGADLDKR